MTPDHKNALPGGIVLGDYRIDSLLGHGGFGITYLAWEIATERRVAIKEYLPRELATRQDGTEVHPVSSQDRDLFDYGLERFLQEGQMLARFRHRNIVRVERYFEANGTAYLVMEYEDGESFTERLERGEKLGEDELERILFPLLQALRVVHRAKLLHRDIKPDNIYLRQDGSPLLLDFGAARHALGARSRSLTAIVTAGYAPHEQYFNDGNQGPWTDIYALGATMYRAIAGVAPPEAPARMKRDGMRPAVEIGKGRFGEAFLLAIDAALDFDDERRPHSVRAWMRMFETSLPPPPAAASPRAEPAVPPPPATALPAPAAGRSHGGRTAVNGVLLGFALFVGLAILAGGGYVALIDAGPARRLAGLMGLGDDAAARDPPLHDCDRLAADPWDPGRKGAGVAWGDLNTVAATATCRTATEDYPQAPRFQAQFGRALFAGNRDKEAVTWFRRAAPAGQASAAFHLGAAYIHGYGVSKDLSQAIKWYRAAAERGHARAQYNLGDQYFKGIGVAKDDAAAVTWYRKAAEQGYAAAQNDLGYMYEEGRGVAKSHGAALSWYRKAATAGYATAQYNLGDMYFGGRGVARNYKQAVTWYGKAAAQGYAMAQNDLGWMYQKGFGVARDYVRARRWYRKAAVQGNAAAQNNLGFLYDEGLGTKEDNAEAYFWYSLAIKRGDATAKKNLATIENSLSRKQKAAIRRRVAAWKPKS